MTPALRKYLTGWQGCGKDVCVLTRIDERRLLLVRTQGQGETGRLDTSVIDTQKLEEQAKKDPSASANAFDAGSGDETPTVTGVDLSRATVEIRTVERRQAFVDGKPVGEPFP